MARPDNGGKYSAIITMAAIAIVVGALYVAQDVLVPLALAILLSFLLAPLVTRLEKLRLPRIGAVLVVAVLCFSLLGGIGWVVWTQLADIATKLPEYRENIHNKMLAIRSSTGGTVSRTSEVLKQISSDLSAEPASQPATQPAGAAPALLSDAAPSRADAPPARPVPVQVVAPPLSPWQFLRSALGPLLGPLGTTGLVIIFVLFILYQREDLRDRIIRLISHGQLNLTTQVMDEAARRVSRYLLMQLVVNVTYGVPIAIGLYVIGVPNALLWGLLATVLRFIPYVGPWVAAVMPISLAIAVSPGWGMPIATVCLFIVMELISNNVVEPLLYGASTGISPIAVIVAAVFWTWLWGATGLLLATPLTVCLAVLGKYVPQFHFLNILLGDEPVLDPGTRVYQRLLADDQEEAADVIEEYLEDQPLIDAYDRVLIPALALAEQDRHRGTLDEARLGFIQQSMREILDDLADKYKLSEVKAEEVPGAGKPEREHTPTCVLCLPAHDEADEIVAMMLAQVLEMGGCRARYVPVAALASEMVDATVQSEARVVCISALPPSAVAHARYLCKRLLTRLSELTIVVGLWNTRMDVTRGVNRLRCRSSDLVATSLTQAAEQIRPLIQSMSTVVEHPATTNA